MPTSKKRKRTQKRQNIHGQLQTTRTHISWSIKNTLNSSWKRLVAILALVGSIASIWGVVEVVSGALRDPEIEPNQNYSSNSSIVLPFIVYNKSTRFDMRNVKLTCILVRVTYESDDGWTLTVPTNPEPKLAHISEQTNAIIKLDNFVNFPCDSTNTIRDPRQNNQPMKLKAEQVKIEITYKTQFILVWSRTYISHNFRRDAASGFQWIPGEFIR